MSAKTSETIKFIFKESGFENILKKENEEDLEKLENIKELVTLATRYDNLPTRDGIEKLLEDSALASKGLEFEYVFITGLENGLFPHISRSDEKKDEEEERRLFYVALTRAKKKIFLTYASTRMIFGSQTANPPSEFILDIDNCLLDEAVFEDAVIE